jgi:hypothetical protein
MATTVMRTHLRFHWEPTNLADFLLVGLLVAPMATEFDDINPDQNPELQWLLLTATYPTASAAVQDAAKNEEFDIRARRRVAQQQSSYFLVVFNPAGTTRNFQFYSRTLLALP